MVTTLGGNDVASDAPPAPSIPARYLDGIFTGIIQDGDRLRVRIERPMTLTRDTDGCWLIFSWRDGQDREPESISVRDPESCDVLDALFELTANPDDFDGATFGADHDE